MVDFAGWISWWRGKQLDKEKAWAYLEEQSDAAFREMAKGVKPVLTKIRRKK